MLNFIDELWAEVVGYEGSYKVSTHGRVYSISRDVILKTFPTGTVAYLYARLSRNNKPKHFAVHRLVATAFIANPERKAMVNHRDGNKLNNNACNLEWVTCSENHRHAYAAGFRTPARAMLGVKCGRSSQYANVSYDSTRGKWKSSVKVHGKGVGQRRFATEQEAAAYVNEILDLYGLDDRPRNVIK